MSAILFGPQCVNSLCLVTPYGVRNLGQTGLGNDSLPDYTKQLHEPMLSYQ